MPKEKKLSIEHKKKLSEAKKLFYQNGGINPLKGKTLSEETRKKMSKTWKQFYQKGGISPRKDKKTSEETRNKMSKARKRFLQNGGIPPMRGKKHTEDSKKKISETRRGLYSGEKCPTWIDGRSFFPYPTIFNQQLKNKIRKRDNYTCQKCNKLEEEELDTAGRRLTIHHIDYNKMNCAEENLITLCRECNSIINFNRNSWTNFFTLSNKVIYE